jgi:spermidine synthase
MRLPGPALHETHRNVSHHLSRLPPGPLHSDFARVEIRGDSSAHGRLVLMDGVEASHVDLADPLRLEFEYLRHLVGVLDVARPEARLRALQVGGGPCALARRLVAARPDARVTVVERDGALIDIAKEWLGLEPSDRLRVVVNDGRAEIRRQGDASLDLVVIDAFVGRVVPLHLVTTQFADEVRRALRPDGVHLVNLIDEPPLDYAASIAATLQEHYSTVLVMADPEVLGGRSAGNVVVVATDGPMPMDEISRLIARDRVPWTLLHGKGLRRLTYAAVVLHDDDDPPAASGPAGNP